jgi:hypothetical protein
MKDFTAKNVEFESLNISGDQGNLNVFDAFKVGASGSVGDVSPTGVDDIIKWDGAKWIAGANPGGTGGGSGGTSVPSFSTALTSGEYSQTVSFGQTLPAAPSIATDLEIDGDGNIIPYTISGLSTTGYYALFAEEIPNNNYKIHTVFGGGGGSGSAGTSYWSTGANGDLISDDSIDVAGGIDFSGHILPAQNSQFDIGSAEYKIRHLYLSSNSLYIGDNRLSTAPDGAIDFPQGITTSGNISTTKDVVVSGNLDFTSIGGTSPAEANDLIAWNGAKWTAQSPAALGLGGGGASSEVPNSFTTNIPNGSEVYAINWEPSLGVLDSVPRIAATVEIDGAGEIIPHTVSGVSTTGYHIVFSEAINTSNYRVHTVFGGKDVYWKTGASALSYTDNNVDISRNLYVGQNVGIGTTSPIGKLDVRGSGDEVFLNLQGGSVGNVKLRMAVQGASTKSAYIEAIQNGTETDLKLNDSLYLKSDGNVGIGTTNPVSELDVAGITPTLTIKDTQNKNWTSADTTLGELAFRTSDTSGIGSHNVAFVRAVNEVASSSTPSGGLSFGVSTSNTNVSEAMRIDSEGNVGIGTSSPSSTLSLYSGSVGGARVTIQDSGTGTTSSDGTILGVDSSQGLYIFNREAKAVYFGTSNTERMRIDSNGNVGIGTTNPSAKLDVRGSADGSTPLLRLNSTTDANDNSAMIVFRSPDAGGNGANYGIATVSASTSGGDDHYMLIGKWTGSAIGSGLVVDTDNKVGIGTRNPNQKLEVLRSGGGKIRLSESTERYVEIAGYAQGLANGSTMTFSTNQTNTSTLTERMRINSSGNVGIGVTNPGSYRLYVGGNIYASGTITPSSDDRVKHNEQPIIGALETLSKITPKKYIKTVEMYDANHDFELDADGNPIDSNGEPVEHRIEAGVIAQQVLTVDELAFAVSPEGVDEDGVVTSPHGLDYNSLFTYAIAAIQEQQQIIEDLKSRIETLEQ